MNNKVNLMLSSKGLNTQALIKFFNDKCSSENIKSVAVVSLQESYEDKKRADYQINQLMQMGYKVRHYNLSEESKRDILKEGQMLYVCGGNTFMILKYMKEKGLMDYFIERIKRGDFYFGISAGSMICCPDIAIAAYAGDKNTVMLEDLSAFDVVPFHIFPHYNDSQTNEVKRFHQDKQEPVIAINDNQLISLDKDGVNVIGDDSGVYGVGIEIG